MSSSSTSSSLRRALAGESSAPTPPSLKRSRPALPTPSPQTGSPFPPGAASPSRKRARVTFGGSNLPPPSPSPPARFSRGLLASGSNGTSRSPLGLPSVRSGSPSSDDSTGEQVLDLPAPLPQPLSNLLAFHRALSLSLAHTLAAHPPVLPPPSARELARDPRGLIESTVLLKGVANWEGTKGIREVVERGAGRKCTGGDLKRLLWLYEWDGQSLPSAAGSSSVSAPAAPITPTASSDSPSDPFFLPSPPAGPPAEVDASRSLLSLSLSPTRTLAKNTRAQTYSYAFNLLLPISGFSGGVVGAIGRWSADQQKREGAVRRRLERWAELGGGPSLPMKGLQPLPGATIALGASSGAAILGPPSSPSSIAPSVGGRVAGGSTALPTPPQSSHSQSSRRLLFPSPSSSTLSSASGTLAPSSSATPPSTPTKAASTSDRRQSLRDRIAAKEAASAPLGGLFASAGIRPGGTAGDKGKAPELRVLSREELKRRSTLSRLAGVAEAVFMLFTSPSGAVGGGSPGGFSGVVRRKAIAIDEVCNVLVKSSKVEISFAEARESLQLLSTLTPDFITLLTPSSTSTVYVELQGSNGGAVPLSPGRKVGALAGNGSPGRVFGGGRAGGGLREVREAIRRELGE